MHLSSNKQEGISGQLTGRRKVRNSGIHLNTDAGIERCGRTSASNCAGMISNADDHPQIPSNHDHRNLPKTPIRGRTSDAKSRGDSNLDMQREQLGIVAIGIVAAGPGGGAIGRGLEEGEGELLVGDADVEVDDAGAGDVDADALDREPQEELLGGHPGQLADLAEPEGAGDVEVVVDLVLEPRVAGLRQADPELPGGRVDGVVGDALGEEADGEAVAPEVVVDRVAVCGGGGGGGEDRRQEGEEEEAVAVHLRRRRTEERGTGGSGENGSFRGGGFRTFFRFFFFGI